MKQPRPWVQWAIVVALALAAVLVLVAGCAWNGGRVVVLFGIGNDAARGDLDETGAVIVRPPARERPRLPN